MEDLNDTIQLAGSNNFLLGTSYNLKVVCKDDFTRKG